MELGGVSDLILTSMYSPSFKSTYLGPSKSTYAWVFSSLDFTKKLSKRKITIWLIDNLLIPVTIVNTLSLEPHLREEKFFARSTTALLTEVPLSLEKEEKKKSRDEREYIRERKTNFLFLVIVHDTICDTVFVLLFTLLPMETILNSHKLFRFSSMSIFVIKGTVFT